jgi:hypothetical protein
MLINLIILLVILSLEATIGLPIFSLYLSYNLMSHCGNKFVLSMLFAMAFILSIFYSVSWPMMTLLLLIFHIYYQQTLKKPAAQILVFILLNLLIFKLAKLQFDYFYFVHWSAFLFYFYKTSFKNY